mgnify:FL=1
MINIEWQTYSLNLKHTFTIARGSRNQQHIVLTKIKHDGEIGYGEASPSDRYKEDQDSVSKFYDKVDLSNFNDPFLVEDILNYLEKLVAGNQAAKAGIDIALYDLIGKKLKMPLWKYFGLNPDKTPTTSFTIGIDLPEIIENKIKEAEDFPILKVKLGVSNDEEIIKIIRKYTDKTLRVDANEGWESKELARDKILFLEKEGVEFVEQPMPAEDVEGIKWLRRQIHIPIIADEAMKTIRDVSKIYELYDGINIKLMKCGGINNALKIIHAAKAMDLKIMLGCMVESSVGIAAAAQLSPLVDYADLDGNILITNDPFTGIYHQKGKIILSNKPGLGIQPCQI